MPRNPIAAQRQAMRGLMRLLGNHLEAARAIAPGTPAQHQAHRMAASLLTLVDATLIDVGQRSGVSLSDEDRVRQMQAIALLLSPPGGSGMAEAVFQPAYEELQREDLLEQMLSLASELRMHAFHVPAEQALQGRDATPAQREQQAMGAMQLRNGLLEARVQALGSLCDSLFHTLRLASNRLGGAYAAELMRAAEILGVRLVKGAKGVDGDPVVASSVDRVEGAPRQQVRGG